MNSKEIGQWCLENKKMFYKIISKFDRDQDNAEDNFNQIVLALMKKGTAFNSSRGTKFTTYAYIIATNEMVEYSRRKRCKLSYPHYCLTRKEEAKKIMNSVAEQGKSFGSIPDYVEIHAGAKDLSFLDDMIDRAEAFKKVNYIINNYLPPIQKRLMNYRYNENLECVGTLVDYALLYGVSPAAAFGLEKSAIKNIQKRLGLIKVQDRRKKNGK